MEKFEENDCLFLNLFLIFEIVVKENKIENKKVFIYLYFIVFYFFD